MGQFFVLLLVCPQSDVNPCSTSLGLGQVATGVRWGGGEEGRGGGGAGGGGGVVRRWKKRWVVGDEQLM